MEDSIDAHQYLDRLYTYLLALGLAGVGGVPTTPDTASETSIGAVTTLFAQVPLDIVMAYFWRAKKSCQMQQAGTRLRWLERQDVAERTQWVAEFRDGDGTLGAVIKETMKQRDAHWSQTETVVAEDRRQPPEQREQPPKQREQASSGAKPQGAIVKLQGSKDAVIAGHKCSLLMKDSTRLCRAFQTDQCRSKGTECPNGKHQCAVLVRDTGRVCGLKNHGASQHRQ
jgi:hypothetical protein